MQSLVVVTEPEGSQRLARIVVSGPSQQQQRLSRNRHDPGLLEGGGGGGGAGDHHGHHHHNSNGHYPVTRKLGPAPELNLSAFQEHMAFSYFFATYGWAYFWKPFLQLARENDLAPTASHMCSLALAYGHMGLGHSDKTLKSMGLELYGRSMREVQTLLSRGAEARAELARLCVPIVILGMYSVRPPPSVPPSGGVLSETSWMPVKCAVALLAPLEANHAVTASANLGTK